MPAFWMEATLYTIDDASYKRFVDRWKEQIMRAGVKQFLRAALARIPKRTGFLRGAFSKIRREFSDAKGGRSGNDEGEANLLSRIFGQNTGRHRVNPKADDPADREKRIRALMQKHEKRANPKGKGTGGKEYYSASIGGKGAKILKTTTSGIQFATPPEKVLQFTDNIVTFQLDIAISYYRINDFYAKIKGAPWQSMMEGGSAMANWLGKAADRFPDITQILVRQKIVLRGSRIGKTTDQQIQASRFLEIGGLEGADGPIPAGPAPQPDAPNSKRELQRNRILAKRRPKNRDFRDHLLKRGEYQKKLKEAGVEPKKKKGG